MSRPNPDKVRDRAGHRPDCTRPFIEWADVLGNMVGTCRCGAVFTRRVDWAEAPALRHARWCSEPEPRRSDVPLDRSRTRWRCPECGAECTVTGGA